MSARRTVVVTDLDGTLWSDELVVGPRTLAEPLVKSGYGEYLIRLLER